MGQLGHLLGSLRILKLCVGKEKINCCVDVYSECTSFHQFHEFPGWPEPERILLLIILIIMIISDDSNKCVLICVWAE